MNLNNQDAEFIFIFAHMKKIIAAMVSVLAFMASAAAQRDFGGTVRFDKTVFDFGRVDLRDGAVSCSFEVTNIGDKPLNILAVTTSCSCTTPKWTKGDIAPGKNGRIDVSYTNDEGPYPFDKALTVYIDGLEKPVILHVKGTAFKGRKK